MDGLLRRLTPLVLLCLAGMAWFGPWLLEAGGLDKSITPLGLTRFILGVICFYTMLLVLERQGMEARFAELLRQFKRFYDERAAGGDVADNTQKGLQAARILIAALRSPEGEVRSTALENLQRLTGKDFGRNTEAWEAWLEEAQQALDRHGAGGAGSAGS